MMINTVFTAGRNAGAGKVATRPQPRIVNPTKDNMREMERAAAARGRMNSLSASLQSAMASLESANKDIDRLTLELQKEREKNAGLKTGSMEDVTALKDEIVKLKDENAILKDQLQVEREKSARMLQKPKRGRKPQIHAPLEAPETEEMPASPEA